MSATQSLLDDITARVLRLPESARDELIDQALEATKNKLWVPNPGPQTTAVLCDADELFYGGEAGGGKDLALDTALATPTGWTTMGAVTVGDQVLSPEGHPCTVVDKSPIFKKEAYRLVFSDGETIVAGPGHQWVTTSLRERARKLSTSDAARATKRAKRPPRGTGKRPDLALRNTLTKTKNLPLDGIRTTAQIMATLKIGHRLNHAVAVAYAQQLPPAELLIEPYVLGAWLGDGSAYGGSITGIDQEIFQRVAGAGYGISRRSVTISPGILGLQKQLRQLGLLGNKHVPPAYLRGSHEQRQALLQGLMDTDGYCDSRGQCEFTTIRRQLADSMHELLATMGIKATITEGLAKLGGRVIGPKYRLKFITEIPAFHLPRKLLRQKRAAFRGTHAQRYIVAVEPAGVVPTQCIQVDSKSRCYLASRSMIPTHNSDLGVGLAFEEHQFSLILRRVNDDAKELAERALEILGTRDGYNGSDHVIRRGRQNIRFGGCKDLGDRQRYKGKPRDLIVFDEIPDFLEGQYRFIIGWNRSANPKQRCRVVCTGNPPTTAEGLWVIAYWGAWLDPTHAKFGKVKEGELLWYTTINGVDTEVDGPGPHQIEGELKPVRARSRTFIRAKLEDNPDLARTNYDAVLASLPEELRDAYRGGKFDAGLRDKPFQLIPTAWVRAAFERWTPQPPMGVPMCAMGVDCTGGGTDPMVIAPRHDGWYPEPIVIQGKEIPAEKAGRMAGGFVIAERRDNATVIVDMGGGYGGPCYEHLHENLDQGTQLETKVKQYKGSEASVRRSQDGAMGFTNMRTQALWRFREALDPSQIGGSPISLFPDNELLADLTTVTYEVSRGAYKAMPKETVCALLGRSTNKGDAVVMAWTAGPVASTDGATWDQYRKEMARGSRPGGHRPTVVMGRTNARTRR